MTAEQAVADAMALVGLPAAVGEAALRERLLLLVDNALEVFARKVAGDKKLSHLLRSDFALTVSSGVASLSAHLAASEPLLLDSVPRAEIFSSGSSYRWQYVGDRSVLALHSAGDFINYTVAGTNIYTNASDGSATLKANKVPTITNVPPQLEGEYVATLAGMVGQAQEVAAQ